KCCLCRGGSVEAEVAEEGQHVDADVFVVAVDGGPGFGFASQPWTANPGEDRGDGLVAEGEQSGDGACCGVRDVVAAAAAGFVDQLVAAQFPQVVRGLPGGVGGLSGQRMHLGGELGGGEAVGGDG